KVSREDEIDRILASLDREKLPYNWKALDGAALREEIKEQLPERRLAPNLECEIKELIEWGLLTPISEDGPAQCLLVHSLVRECCHERQTSGRWSWCLREAAACYTNFTRMIPYGSKDLAVVWCEMQAFELLMEAEEYGAAADLLASNSGLLDRWGF